MLALALAVSLHVGGVAAPGLDWKTIHSECCDVHFPRELLPLAERVATIADESVVTASAFLKSAPADRIQIVIHDVTDSPNGFTYVVPYDLVDLRAVTPESDSDLAVTDEYMRLLVLHEILHVVHLDTIHGLPALVNLVVGKVWPPNLAQPRFIFEGLATYVETQYTQGGRLTSELFTSELRIAALANDLWTLDDLSNYSRRNPGGGAAYVYGAGFARFIADKHGPEVWAQIAHDYGGTFIPFAMQRSVEQATGHDFTDDWNEFIAGIRRDADAFRAAVDARGGPTRARRITRIGGTIRAPTFDGDDVIVSVDSPHVPAGLYALRGLPDAAPRPEPIARTTEPGDVVVVDDTLIVSQGEISRGWYSMTDLWRVDGQRFERLTRELRARHPSRVPGTRTVIAEQRSAIESALVQVDIDSGDVRDVVRFTDGSIAYSPNVSPDGSHVVYSRWQPGGARDIVERNLSTGAERALTTDAPQDLDPTYTRDGLRVLFASDREGTFAIYAVDRETRELRRIVDTLGLARDPVPSPDGTAVLYIDTHLEGHDLYAAPYAWERAPIVAAREPSPPARALTPRLASKVDDYNPFLTMLPRYYIPILATGVTGAPAVGVAVVGEDAASLYSWAAQATYDLGFERPALSASFRFADLYFPLALSAEWRTDLTDRFRRNDGAPEFQIEQVLRGSAALSIPLFRRRIVSHSLTLAYTREHRIVETPLTSDPDSRAPVYGPNRNVGAVTIDWGYSQIDVGRDAVSNERGFTSFFRVRHANPLFTGSEVELTEVLVDARAFQPVPGLSNHVVALYMSGGVGIGDPTLRASFALGGFEDRDLTQDLLTGRRAAGGVLRGYPAFVLDGDAQALATLEYRLPLIELEKGVETLPLFVERVHGAAFSDVGLVFDGAPKATQARASIGVELRLEFTLAYYGLFLVRLGYARGVNQDGVDQPYVVMGFPY